MNKHTPGPWAQGRLLMTSLTQRWSEEAREKADHEERCMVFADFRDLDEGRGRRRIAICETEEDARLIAAAPDLLEMLKELAGEMASAYDIIDEDRLIKARAVIEKATGSVL